MYFLYTTNLIICYTNQPLLALGGCFGKKNVKPDLNLSGTQ